MITRRWFAVGFAAVVLAPGIALAQTKRKKFVLDPMFRPQLQLQAPHLRCVLAACSRRRPARLPFDGALQPQGSGQDERREGSFSVSDCYSKNLL